MRKRVMDGPPATTKLPHGAVTHLEAERVGEREREGQREGERVGQREGERVGERVGERQTTVSYRGGLAFLATQARQGPSWPFGSHVPLNDDVRPRAAASRDTVPMKWGYVGAERCPRSTH